MPELAALVSKPEAEAAIAALETEGVYDDSRRVAAYDDDRVALPITREPVDTTVERVVPADLPVRKRGLCDRLEARGFTAEELDAVPRSWAVVGSVISVDFGDVSGTALDESRRLAVGEALLELHGEADTVVSRGKIAGRHREPSVEVVAGEGDTETVHTEHGTEYALDLSRVMFSPGNQAERARMGDVVEGDEHVFDMFAGIGYFTLPMARAGADVTAVEINPEAYRFLAENAVLNGVHSRVNAVLGDCRDVETTADRVVMGYYDAHEYLDAALSALVPGGTLHLHEATPASRFPERPIERLETAASAANREVDVLESRVVKSHSEGVVHGVVDARIE